MQAGSYHFGFALKSYAVGLAFALLANVSLVTLLLYGSFETTATSTVISIVLLCLLSSGLCVGIYLIKRESKKLQQSAYDLHAINHIYRDALSNLFSTHEINLIEKPELKRLLLIERAILIVICQKIASIYGNLIHRKCVVTVKLIKAKNKQKFVFTWARSEEEIFRSDSEAQPGEIPLGVQWYSVEGNTGFSEALKFRDSSTSYFHSRDLIKDEKRKRYTNLRSGWQKLYKSAIIVPIRHASSLSENDNDELGFLCIDTQSRYRLNDGYHVQLLAAFADQMYNFISIMRQKYYIPSKEEEIVEKQEVYE